MAEYIEREEVLAMKYGGVVDVADIKAITAAEVVPLRHGRWKYYHKQGIAVCTQCSFERKLDADFGRAVSCPNCGAMMDGDSDG